MATDDPISHDEYLALLAARVGKEPSKALPKPKYNDPANQNIQKGLKMHLKAADGKVQEWWIYTRSRDSSHGYPKEAPYCRESVSSRQWDSTSDIADSWAHSAEMEMVDELIDTMDGVHKAAITAEMRNRESGRVWRVTGKYEDAVEALAILLCNNDII